MGWDALSSTLPYGPMWRMHRRWFQSSFLAKHVFANYRPLQTRTAHRLLLGFLKYPEEYMAHIRKFSANLAMEIGYGHVPDDHFTNLVREVVETAVAAAPPPSSSFDLFPFLKYVPDWVPGAGFKRKYTRIRKVVHELHERSPGLLKDSEARHHQLSALSFFMLAMVLYPEVFQKAQAEIDRVIGRERLPDFGDRDSLPYLECVIQEVYRCVILNNLFVA
ncbi:cytochrome P450 [Wolfiporia cocos MD-104 SS10]|uniref:Cytochrome P450 n=1 Tax=Wolfiporia cocos (strain MD-104) TaxID=742152 RepID=A0A2H3J915_WOLCO|nr:cytochrome P450 [Wolfiporia cocos MD-104 SS10]